MPYWTSGSAPRLYRNQEASHSLQLLPRSIPARPQSLPRSSHHRSPSPSRFLRFEDSPVNEKSRFDGFPQMSPTKTESSTSRAVALDPLASRHQPYPSSAASLRHLTSHQSSASPDYSLSPIPDTASSHFALPLPSLHSGYLHPPRKIRLWSILKPWLPVLAYLLTSLGFLVATVFWKKQVFQGAVHSPVIPPYALSPSIHPFRVDWGCHPLTFFFSPSAGLDNLSSWLKVDKNFGYGVLFFLIFITTFRK